MMLQEIKQAVDEGKSVYWKTPAYRVIKDGKDQYFIQYVFSDCWWGLTHKDGVTLAENEQEFFIGKE